jgi:hypothetical protein
MHALQARLSGPVAGSRPTMAIPWLPGSCVSNLQKFTRHVILAMPDAAVRPGAGEDAADQQNPVRQEQQQVRLSQDYRHSWCLSCEMLG